MDKLSVMIIDDNKNLLKDLEEVLNQDSEIEVIATADNGSDGCRLIREKSPDVVILDLIMPCIDGLGVMEMIKQDDNIPIKPKFIVISGVRRESLTEEIFRLGASYFMLKPFEAESVRGQVKRIACEDMPYLPNKYKKTRMDEMIETEILRQLDLISIPARIKGYRYLRDAILVAFHIYPKVYAVTRDIYPVVAQAHGTNYKCVERAMRHAIELAWQRGDPDQIHKVFSSTIDKEKGKPTNSELIALISEKVRIDFWERMNQGS